MATLVKAHLTHFDHATVPSVDLLPDLDFYEKFFDAEMPSRKSGMMAMVNFSIARRKAGRAPIFFLMLGERKLGLFLQDEYPPEPLRLLEGPR